MGHSSKSIIKLDLSLKKTSSSKPKKISKVLSKSMRHKMRYNGDNQGLRLREYKSIKKAMVNLNKKLDKNISSLAGFIEGKSGNLTKTKIKGVVDLCASTKTIIEKALKVIEFNIDKQKNKKYTDIDKHEAFLKLSDYIILHGQHANRFSDLNKIGNPLIKETRF